MADSRDFREDMQRIGGLVQEMEAIADPAVRAATQGLVQSLMDLHGAALEKALDIVADAGEQRADSLRPPSRGHRNPGGESGGPPTAAVAETGL